MATRLDVIKRVQARIGDEPIRSEDDPGADTHIETYETVRADLLTRHGWSFNTVTRSLPLAVAVPPAHWTKYYTLPADMIGAPLAVYNSNAGPRRNFIDCEITEGYVATNASAIWIRHQKDAAPDVWPGYFASLFDTTLMAQFALSIREDRELSTALMHQVFGKPEVPGDMGMLGAAAWADMVAQPPPEIRDGVVEDLIGRYPWSWAKATVKLDRQIILPSSRWKWYFALPDDMVGTPRAVYTSVDRATPVTDFELTDSQLACDADDGPERWPGPFRKLVDTVTKAEIALMPIVNKRTMAAMLKEEAFGSPSMMGEGGMLGQAKNADAQSQPARRLRFGDGPLISVRR
jgi:hypothetical protein